MSDFDKEAEREKLREQFEQEEKQREATEQMSELLLKGATMTNAHCSDCGDPIFRYDGQEFCPSCQKPITRDPETAEDGDHIEVANPSDDAHVQFGGQEADGTDQATPDENSPAPAEQSPTDQPTGQAPADRPSEPSTGDRTTRSTASNSQPSRTDHTDGTGPELGGATPSTRTTGLPDEASAELAETKRLLAATSRRFAQRAADSEDPRDAREHLQAVRDAADALDAATF